MIATSVFDLAERIAGHRRRPGQFGTDPEVMGLARAVNLLASALLAAAATDRTTSYAPGELDPAGRAPPPGDAWATPAEIARAVLPAAYFAPPSNPASNPAQGETDAEGQTR